MYYTKLITKFLTTSFMVSQIFSPMTGLAQEFDIDAEAALLMEADTGRIIYEENISEKLAPASLTKIMTLVIGLEAIEEGELELDETTVTSTNAWESVSQEESQMFLNAGQEVSIEELLKGIAVVSANDACIVLAEHMYGSVDQFVDEMNAKADEIGLENTNFQDNIGLDFDDQYMSAKDVGLLSQYAIQNTPEILELESIPEFEFNDISQYNRNVLLPERDTSYSYEGTDGLKTGRTAAAGHNFVATADRNNTRYISVILGTEERNDRYSLAIDLLDYGYNNYDKVTIIEENKKIDSVPIKMGQEREVAVVSEHNLDVITETNDPDELSSELKLKQDKISAPVTQGDKLGELVIYENSEKIGSVNAIASEDVDELGFFGRILRGISNIITDALQSIRESILSFIFD
ncbi:D-alanyl-D-alanine carboxypeptidase family protein [Natranaerobius trueperi]|uniref:serine-type D-Ala-D-Ala carboxypeptidase n=1 Tax=Natranaerobius trueperi TaxID=759412 RepID=A0A226BVS2_9FIRM|nr:D-alanyl-D-alanine carboxypeptidase family protein [Natranaerobius trueperi]OWZ83075.1 hypothetical protein CDO51_10605 [Natranaerobius trueperi]